MPDERLVEVVDDKCDCGHWMLDHSEVGCENCMCEDFRWPLLPEDTPHI